MCVRVCSLALRQMGVVLLRTHAHTQTHTYAHIHTHTRRDSLSGTHSHSQWHSQTQAQKRNPAAIRRNQCTALPQQIPKQAATTRIAAAPAERSNRTSKECGKGNSTSVVNTKAEHDDEADANADADAVADVDVDAGVAVLLLHSAYRAEFPV